MSENLVLNEIMRTTKNIEVEFHRIEDGLKRDSENEELKEKKQILFRDAEKLQQLENRVKGGQRLSNEELEKLKEIQRRYSRPY